MEGLLNKNTGIEWSQSHIELSKKIKVRLIMIVFIIILGAYSCSMHSQSKKLNASLSPVEERHSVLIPSGSP